MTSKNLNDDLKKKERFFPLKAADKDKVKESEAELGVKFSKEYKDYVMEFGAVSYYGHELTGVCKSRTQDVVTVTKRQREYLPEIDLSLYVIEETGCDGCVIWQSEDGEIFASNVQGKLKKICNSLFDYINRE